THGAHLLTVDLFDDDAAWSMFAQRLAPRRVMAEPDAAREIVGCCAGLPLALALVAARAAARTHLPLAALAQELREARGGLDVFDSGDPATDLRVVFLWPYRTLRSATGPAFAP